MHVRRRDLLALPQRSHAVPWAWVESGGMFGAGGCIVGDECDNPSKSEGLFPHQVAVLRCSRAAMATTFEVIIPQAYPQAIDAAEDALDQIDAVEDQLTVYRETSEVSHLNAHAPRESVPVREDLFTLLERCAAYWQVTAGAFDVAMGALVKAWGFYQRQGRVPSHRELKHAMARSGMRHVILDRATQRVRFRVPGLELNFGAIGKGYALDRAAQVLCGKWGITSALLHAGCSSVLAVGSPPGDDRGWAVRLRHPWVLDRSLGIIRLRDRALGVSAATHQHFHHQGQRLGHLLDPRRGWPVQGRGCSAVLAPSAAEADAFSTALFVLGHAGAERLTRLRPQLSAIVLDEDQSAPTCYNLNDAFPVSDPVERDERTTFVDDAP